MKIIFIYLFLILRIQGKILINQTPPGKLNTSFEPLYSMESSSAWTTQCAIQVKLEDTDILIYLPYHKRIVTSNQNFLNVTMKKSAVIFQIQFDKIKDGEKYLKIFYTSNTNIVSEEYSTFIEYDFTAEPLLTWNHYENPDYFKGIKHVNDEIEIICIKINGLENDKILLTLPNKLSIVNSPTIEKDIYKVSVRIGEETDGMPVTCKIGERSVTSYDILSTHSGLKGNYKRLSYILTGTEAILSIIFFGCIFVPIGMYLVLIKQRSIYTEKRVKKITDVAQDQLHMIQNNGYSPVRNNNIMNEAGLSHSRKFNRKLNQARAHTLGNTNIEMQMNKIEELHELAKMESAVLESE